MIQLRVYFKVARMFASISLLSHPGCFLAREAGGDAVPCNATYNQNEMNETN